MNDFVIAVGALAEMCGLMRVELMKNGFTRQEAVAMTTEYLKTVTAPDKKKEEK